MKTLLLKFAGPLQAWGTSSDFETRSTDLYPSKSAVIGLLAASLGYRRQAEQELKKLNELDFAVRIDQMGNLLRDYHTAMSFKRSGDLLRTYVTNRYYIEDGIFLVALGHQDIAFMEELEEALQKPYFQTFMGRRSLPLNADFYQGMTGDGVILALQKAEWQASDWYKKANRDLHQIPIYADAHLLPDEDPKQRRDFVISFDQKGRSFAYRLEAKTKIDLPKENLPQQDAHDAFAALGE